jgi:pre-mRNA-splicing factor SYF2
MAEVNIDQPTTASEPDSAVSRAEKFKSLRAKLAASTKANHDEVIAEHKRMKINPSVLTKLDRKKAEAEIKLAKQDAEDAGEDFERKRAWDWTIEESLAWDRRLAEKKENRDKSGFSDYTQLAEKSYRQDMRAHRVDMEEYKRARDDALAKGQVVETEDGKLVALDEDRRFYADANTVGLADHKPRKQAVERLAEEVKKKYVVLISMLISQRSRQGGQTEEEKGQRRWRDILHQQTKQGLQREIGKVLRSIYAGNQGSIRARQRCIIDGQGRDTQI